MSLAPESARTRAPVPQLRTGDDDRWFDYCLQPYRPRRPPQGKLRAENLLWVALEHAGLAAAAREPLRALQAQLGRDMTVWGIKHDGARQWVELYVYDPRKEDPRATLSGLAEILAPWLSFTPRPPESIPYMMVSFDLDADALTSGRIDEVNLYLAGTDEHAGRSYRVRADACELDNTYRFMHPKLDVDMVLSLARSSTFVDYSDPRMLGQVLVPELLACKRVCVAKKRMRDGIYFSGIDVEQLAWFCERFAYPAPLREYLAVHGGELDHLYFDVGVDYEPDPAGGLRWPKSSFYGTL
jgi:hypothetical protein